MDDDPRIPGASPINPQSLNNLLKAALEEEINQQASEDSLESFLEFDAFNPMAMMRRFRPINEFRQTKSEEKQKVETKKVLAVEKIEESAARFQRNNDELHAKTLLILRSRIHADDSPDDVLKKVLETYPDHALADEALDFLLETADLSTATVIRLAKEQLNLQFGRDIKAGRNMGTEAREFSKEGLGSPTSLRDMYRDITGTAREPLKLFEELSEKFTYEKLRTAIHFLLHALGADLKAKGPSIPRPELKRLLDETRSLQGILGIYRFFKERMALMQNQFASNQILMPPKLKFDTISKQFVKFLAERFISPDKILQASRLLGISEEALAQLIIYTQMRDAIKQIAPRYYRNNLHRDELLAAFLKVLEELDDRIEEEAEEKARQEKQKKKKQK
jgi:type III secretion protein W